MLIFILILVLVLVFFGRYAAQNLLMVIALVVMLSFVGLFMWGVFSGEMRKEFKIEQRQELKAEFVCEPDYGIPGWGKPYKLSGIGIEHAAEHGMSQDEYYRWRKDIYDGKIPNPDSDGWWQFWISSVWLIFVVVVVVVFVVVVLLGSIGKRKNYAVKNVQDDEIDKLLSLELRTKEEQDRLLNLLVSRGFSSEDIKKMLDSPSESI